MRTLTSEAAKVERVTPCAPQPSEGRSNGAHGVSRPTLLDCQIR